jgi:heme oxygenase (biliverdin-IX-beta and delta-forming)
VECLGTTWEFVLHASDGGDDTILAYPFCCTTVRRLLPAAPSPATTEPADPVAALRRATRAQHDRIDGLMALHRMCDAAHYARVLRVFAPFLAGWEPSVAAALPDWQGWLRARSRRAFLQQDLQHLALQAPPPADWPGFADAACAWGSLYVVEGSALGGQFIARSLAQAGLHADSGAAYFNGWGPATGRLWRQTRDVLNAQLASPSALELASAGACMTFEFLSQMLERLSHERTALA